MLRLVSHCCAAAETTVQAQLGLPSGRGAPQRGARKRACQQLQHTPRGAEEACSLGRARRGAPARMVLNEMGQKISQALAFMNNAETLDEKVLDACLKEVCTALLQADVNAKLVFGLRTNVKTRAANADKGAGLNKRKIIEKARARTGAATARQVAALRATCSMGSE